MTASARPAPGVSAETTPFWDGAARGVLSVPHCEDCGTIFFPPAARCPHCLSSHVAWKDCSGRGYLRSWTELHVAPYPGSPKPALVAEIEPIENRSLALAMLVETSGTEGLVLGAPVMIGFAADANGWTYPVARPAPATSDIPHTSLASERAGHDR